MATRDTKARYSIKLLLQNEWFYSTPHLKTRFLYKGATVIGIEQKQFEEQVIEFKGNKKVSDLISRQEGTSLIEIASGSALRLEQPSQLSCQKRVSQPLPILFLKIEGRFMLTFKRSSLILVIRNHGPDLDLMDGISCNPPSIP
ncbi:hypothetical protein Tco_0659178 [Tanacetum coccineum]